MKLRERLTLVNWRSAILRTATAAALILSVNSSRLHILNIQSQTVVSTETLTAFANALDKLEAHDPGEASAVAAELRGSLVRPLDNRRRYSRPYNYSYLFLGFGILISFLAAWWPSKRVRSPAPSGAGGA